MMLSIAGLASYKQPHLPFILQVTKSDQIWEHLETLILPGMYWNEYDNGSEVPTYEQQFIADQAGFRIGQPRLRQLRVQRGICLIYVLNQRYNICSLSTSCAMLFLASPPAVL